MQRMEEVLTPRELNLVQSYLGIGKPDEAGMTFQELAIYLNQLQRPQRSGEGVQGRAAEAEKGLIRRGLRSVALCTESHPRRQSGGGAGRGASRNTAENMVGGAGTGESV